MVDFEIDIEEFELTPEVFKLVTKYSRHSDNNLEALYALLIENQPRQQIYEKYGLNKVRLSQIKDEFYKNLEKALDEYQLENVQLVLPKKRAQELQKESEEVVKNILRDKQ